MTEIVQGYIYLNDYNIYMIIESFRQIYIYLTKKLDFASIIIIFKSFDSPKISMSFIINLL